MIPTGRMALGFRPPLTWTSSMGEKVALPEKLDTGCALRVSLPLGESLICPPTPLNEPRPSCGRPAEDPGLVTKTSEARMEDLRMDADDFIALKETPRFDLGLSPPGGGLLDDGENGSSSCDRE